MMPFDSKSLCRLSWQTIISFATFWIKVVMLLDDSIQGDDWFELSFMIWFSDDNLTFIAVSSWMLSKTRLLKKVTSPSHRFQCWCQHYRCNSQNQGCIQVPTEWQLSHKRKSSGGNTYHPFSLNDFMKTNALKFRGLWYIEKNQ
jgi:hypothetical protein